MATDTGAVLSFSPRRRAQLPRNEGFPAKARPTGAESTAGTTRRLLRDVGQLRWAFAAAHRRRRPRCRIVDQPDGDWQDRLAEVPPLTGRAPDPRQQAAAWRGHRPFSGGWPAGGRSRPRRPGGLRRRVHATLAGPARPDNTEARGRGTARRVGSSSEGGHLPNQAGRCPRAARRRHLVLVGGDPLQSLHYASGPTCPTPHILLSIPRRWCSCPHLLVLPAVHAGEARSAVHGTESPAAGTRPKCRALRWKTTALDGLSSTPLAGCYGRPGRFSRLSRYATARFAGPIGVSTEETRPGRRDSRQTWCILG